jgi:hypothetical protein
MQGLPWESRSSICLVSAGEEKTVVQRTWRLTRAGPGTGCASGCALAVLSFCLCC